MRNGIDRTEFKESRMKRYYLDIVIPVGVLIAIIIYVVWVLL